MIESTTLSQNQISFINNSGSGGTYYIHGIVNQGYTHQGQLVGASIGPGANSNFISLDFFGSEVLLGPISNERDIMTIIPSELLWGIGNM